MIKSGINIVYAADCIKKGGLVAFPTETVYGLGANALNPIAVARIFEAKQRPSFDPLIVHISEISQLEILFEKEISPLVYKLADAFWPGPLTIVHKKSTIVPDIVTSGLNTVGVRMPSHPIAHELIKLAETPIAAPSANKFGQLSPTRPEHVSKQLSGIDYLVNGSQSMVGIESTVVSVDYENCCLLRPGAISLQDIQEIIPSAYSNFKEREDLEMSSPGLLESHYSPTKPLYILTNLNHALPANSGIILHEISTLTIENTRLIYTSETNNNVEIAANLFTALHKMEDDENVNQIYIQAVEEIGLGVAIMDRVKKAAFRYLTE